MSESAERLAERVTVGEFLALRPAACPGCGRGLAAETGERCGRCGVKLALGLASKESYRVAWSILLAAFFVDATAGALFGVMLLRLGWPRMPREWVLIPILGFVASIPLPVVVLFFRRAFFRLPNWVQWGLMAAGILWTVVLFAVLLLVTMR